MSFFLDGIGAVLKKATEWIPGRIEKIKNERERLLDERHILLQKVFSASGSQRIAWIDKRLSAIDEELRNKAHD